MSLASLRPTKEPETVPSFVSFDFVRGGACGASLLSLLLAAPPPFKAFSAFNLATIASFLSNNRTAAALGPIVTLPGRGALDNALGNALEGTLVVSISIPLVPLGIFLTPLIPTPAPTAMFTHRKGSPRPSSALFILEERFLTFFCFSPGCFESVEAAADEFGCIPVVGG